jgi:hypothetical protein
MTGRGKPGWTHLFSAKRNNVSSLRARARRGGRAAKGGRLKICSRRSSQVQILAPADSNLGLCPE